MKKRIVFFSLFFVSLYLYSAEPLVKFYFQDGITKQYNLNEIDSLNVIDKKNNYVMRIHYDDSLVAYYPTEIIGSIKFEKDSVKRDILNVYIFGYPKSYKLSNIDSLVFYIDQWQPLTIGSQVWMLKNLNVDHYRNGDSIPEVRVYYNWESHAYYGAWCYYDNDLTNGVTYGKLYNWYAVNNPNGLAPFGWHIPTNSEWKTLEIYLGMSQYAADSLIGWRGDSVGAKLKEIGATHWGSLDSAATNESGFSALPGGARFYGGMFQGLGWSCFMWASSEGWSRSLYSKSTAIVNDNYKDLRNGYSIRCIKNPESTLPKIICINPDSAFKGDFVTITGSGFASAQGLIFVSFTNANTVQYENWNDNQIKVKVPLDAESGKVSVTVNGTLSNEYDFTIIADTIEICKQLWKCKNLTVDHYRNGDSIPQVNSYYEWQKLKTGAWCNYNNNAATGEIYGKLYNWYALDDPRGLAPVGWHIPSDDEWKELEMCMGMTQTAADDYLYRGTDEGGKLKEAGTSHWKSSNKLTTNSSRFFALPGGARHGETDCFDDGLEWYGFWWSSSEINTDKVLFRNLDTAAKINRYMWSKQNGYSIRCVRTLETSEPRIFNINPSSAFIGDDVIFSGNGLASAQGIIFISFAGASPLQFENWKDTQFKIKVPPGTISGKVSVTVNGIKSNEVDFTLRADTVKICNQVWMTKNLNVDHYRNGDSIPNIQNPNEWEKIKTGAWCYLGNDTVEGKLFGKLYNWYAVNDPRGLAPLGWHVPNDTEWKTLEMCLGMTQAETDSEGYRGTNEGSKLKESGIFHWMYSNKEVTNSSGFFALPGGSLKFDGWWGQFGCWWSSSEFDISKAWYRELSGSVSGVYRNNDIKGFGFSVRCVKDK